MRKPILKAARYGLLLSSTLAGGGCANVLAFGTATKFGLDIAQRADQTFDVSMGYDRTEIASIPAPDKKDASLGSSENSGEDAYSVLGAFRVRYDHPFNKEPLVLDQLFATGIAARIAARDPNMQAYFGGQAHIIAEKLKEGGEAGKPASEKADALKQKEGPR